MSRLSTALAGTLLVMTAVFGFFGNSAASASGLLISEGGFGGVLEIKEQTVHVTINNGIAVTQID